MPFEIDSPNDGDKFEGCFIVATGTKVNPTGQHPVNSLVFGTMYDAAGKTVCSGTLLSPIDSRVWTMQFHLPPRTPGGRYTIKAFEIEINGGALQNPSVIRTKSRIVIKKRDSASKWGGMKMGGFGVGQQGFVGRSVNESARRLAIGIALPAIEGLFSTARDRSFPIFGLHESSSPGTLVCTATSQDDATQVQIQTPDTVNDPSSEFCFTFPNGLPFKQTGKWDIEVTNTDTYMDSLMSLR